MPTNHFPRLLKLARRTGDRLIVTDEAGGGEPMVILPLDEYELLIDEAFGPGSESGSPALRRRGMGGGELEERIEEVPERTIQLVDDTFETEFQPELPAEPSVELPVARPVVKEPDEADVDEEALQDLWKPQESAVEVKMAEKEEEILVKPVRKQLVGEEQFYLEPLD